MYIQKDSEVRSSPDLVYDGRFFPVSRATESLLNTHHLEQKQKLVE
jgi:hypothetical protein